MHAAITSSLTALGVPPRIAQVYYFVAERGEVAARDVAETFSYTRSTAHDVLATLVQYGFARSVRRGKEKIFCMESPHVILDAFLAERRKAEVRVDALEHVLPMLRALHASGSSGTGVRYFSGVEGLRDIQREFDGLPGDILQLLDVDTFQALEVVRGRELSCYRVIDQAKRTRSIVLTDQRVDSLPLLGAEIRTISRDLISAPGEMSVCGDRVLFLSYVDEISIIEIRSQAIADVCRATLELAWRAAETWGTVVPKSE
jgi:DNA-binding MarR family transcriptional regulator